MRTASSTRQISTTPGKAGLRHFLAPLGSLWPAVSVVVLALLICGAAVALGIWALPVVVLFADLLGFLHLRLVAAERRREAASDLASFHAAIIDLAPVKEPHRARLQPAQIALPFNQWVADMRAGLQP